MQRVILICTVCVLIFAIFSCQKSNTITSSPEDGIIPFPDAMEEEPDCEVARLISIWSNNWNSLARYDSHRRIVSMGSDAVPSLIIIFKRSANKSPFIIEKPRKVQDIRCGELRATLIALTDIADRRALPVISALVKYDNKPQRFGHALEIILLHGSDEQLKRDAKSDDPNIARIAQLILDKPEYYDYHRKKFQKR